jgi:hypothetical protein
LAQGWPVNYPKILARENAPVFFISAFRQRWRTR